LIVFDLVRLRVLVAVARTGSVTAAAAALHYAQPSVSHHLARLEAEAGVPLVQRVGRGVALTEAGRLLVERAEEILGRVESVHTELAAHAELRAGRVRLAAFPSVLATLVPAACAGLAAEHPDLELSLTEAEPPDALSALRAGEVDVALVFEHDDTDPNEYRNVTVSPLLEEPIYLLEALPERPAGPRSRVDSYATERWIAGCPRCRAHLSAVCADAGFSPDIVFETDDYVAVQALVRAGLGVSTLPGLALVAHRDPGVRIHRIPGQRRSVAVATYGRPPVPLPVQAFLDALGRATFRPSWPR
jgi:DNA-binding transcriptional LysR family regulator